MKKIYVCPAVIVENYETENLLYTASPGISSEVWNDEMVIEAKGGSGMFGYDPYGTDFGDDDDDYDDF